MDSKRLTLSAVEWIKDWFYHNGKGCNAVIGISGGKDSSVVAALCVEALGKDRVLGVMMPNGYQPDQCDAEKLIEHLGIRGFEINIENGVRGVAHEVWDALDLYFGDEDKAALSDQAEINLPPRIRMATLYAFSQSVNGRVANTCNYSENFVGYATRFGDEAGDFSPLGNLLTDEVIDIGKELRLPDELVEKIPSDGLCDMTDEESFGFTYDELNRYIRSGTSGDVDIDAKIKRMHDANKFKFENIQTFTPERDFS